MKYALMHVDGCGKEAFYMSTVPEESDPVLSNIVTLLDGSNPKNGDLIICGSCNQVVNRLIISDIKEVCD